MTRYGRFIGTVQTEWLHERGKDRQMRLLRDFFFVDRRGIMWSAPAGSIVDGASIPRVFWRLCDPFIGDYRQASVVHDVACQRREHASADVHRMFYEAMRAGGVRPVQAFLMWAAVRLFGPRFSGGWRRT